MALHLPTHWTFKNPGWSRYRDANPVHTSPLADGIATSPSGPVHNRRRQGNISIYLTERERNVLFNDALNTFYLRLYGVRHMIKDHSDSEKGNPLPPHGLLLSINSKGSFVCTIPQTG